MLFLLLLSLTYIRHIVGLIFTFTLFSYKICITEYKPKKMTIELKIILNHNIYLIWLELFMISELQCVRIK